LRAEQWAQNESTFHNLGEKVQKKEGKSVKPPPKPNRIGRGRNAEKDESLQQIRKNRKAKEWKSNT